MLIFTYVHSFGLYRTNYAERFFELILVWQLHYLEKCDIITRLVYFWSDIMNDEIKNDELPSEENAQDTENDEDTRPPVDPKNKLYTFISLLIFAVLYIG